MAILSERCLKLTPLLPVILMDWLASDPGANSELDMAFSCSFCVFGTAACRATFEIDSCIDVFLNRDITCTVPSAFRCSCSVILRLFLS
jgi:hypothetical protein